MKFLLFTIFITFNVSFFSQKIIWGPEFQNVVTKSSNGIVKFVGERDGKIYSYSWGHDILSVFDSQSMKLIEQNPISISATSQKERHTFLSIGMFNDKIILKSRFYDKLEKEYKIMAYELNEKGQSVNSVLLLQYSKFDSRNSETPMNSDSHLDYYSTDTYHVEYSPDSSTFLIGYSYFNKKEDSYEALVSTFDADLKKLSKNTIVKSKYSTKKYLNHCNFVFAITNEGEWGACSRVWNKDVDPDISTLTQCIELNKFDKNGKVIHSSKLFLDNSTLYLPQYILPKSKGLDSFLIMGYTCDNSKRKIKLENEFKGVVPKELRHGMFTTSVFEKELKKTDLAIVRFDSFMTESDNEVDFALAPIIYDNGLVLVLESHVLYQQKYVAYFDRNGIFNKAYSLYPNYNISSETAQLMMTRPSALFLGSSDAHRLNNGILKPLIRNVNNSSTIEFITYDVLERDINSTMNIVLTIEELRNLNVVLAKITIDSEGKKTRTILDDAEVKYLIYSGINLKLQDGSTVMVGVAGDKGKLVKVTP